MNQDFLSSILSDPEKMKQILSAASFILGGADSASPQETAPSPFQSSGAAPKAIPSAARAAAPDDGDAAGASLPFGAGESRGRQGESSPFSASQHSSGAGAPAFSAGGNASAGSRQDQTVQTGGIDLSDLGAGLFKNALPIISAISASSKNAVSREKMNLLTSVKPFVGAQISSEIDHAVKLVSLAKMAKAALKQLGNQQSSHGTDEV